MDRLTDVTERWTDRKMILLSHNLTMQGSHVVRWADRGVHNNPIAKAEPYGFLFVVLRMRICCPSIWATDMCFLHEAS